MAGRIKDESGQALLRRFGLKTKGSPVSMSQTSSASWQWST